MEEGGPPFGAICTQLACPSGLLYSTQNRRVTENTTETEQRILKITFALCVLCLCVNIGLGP